MQTYLDETLNWSHENDMIINIKNTKETILNFKKSPLILGHLTIENTAIECDVQLPPLYCGQCILANGVDQTQDLSIGNLACYHRAIQSPKFFRHGEPKYLSCT